MPTFLSSIFSFKTLQLAGMRRTGAVLAIVVCAALVTAAEVTSRFALRPTGGYWEYWNSPAAEKFLWYRQAARKAEGPPMYVIVGDSTAARDFLPAVFTQTRGSSAYNLGWPANFPLAFEDSTVPLFEAPYGVPDVVIVSLSPKGFAGGARVEKFEASIKSSPVCRRQRGDLIVADYLYLARLYRARRFARSWFTGKGLGKRPDQDGAQSVRGVDPNAFEPTDDSKQVRLQIDPRRMKPLEHLGRLAKQRDFSVVVLLPPRFDPPAHRVAIEEEYAQRVEELAASSQLPIRVLDCRSLPDLDKQHFFDRGHLNRSGAEVYSRYLAAQMMD